MDLNLQICYKHASLGVVASGSVRAAIGAAINLAIDPLLTAPFPPLTGISQYI